MLTFLLAAGKRIKPKAIIQNSNELHELFGFDNNIFFCYIFIIRKPIELVGKQERLQ